MAVITGVIRLTQIARKAAYRYKYLDLNKKFIRKYVPPQYRRPAEIASDLLITGGVLYQAAVEIDRSGIFKKKSQITSGKFRQTRNYMVKSRSKRFYCPSNRFGYRR